MHYTFDVFGWYTGSTNDAMPRSTPVEPPSTSTSSTPGEMRANYVGIPGSEWQMLPYTHAELPTPTPDTGAIWEAIKAERDRRTQVGGYRVGDHWFHSDTFSRTQQLGLVMLGANLPEGLQWKTMSGAFVTMTPTLAQQVFAAATSSDMAHFAHAEYLRGLVEAAEDAASVDIYAGWPPIFGEA
jgi:hypothetical protein